MSEITKTKDQNSKTKSRLIRLSVALAIAAVYFFGLSIPLLGPDEPRYAQVAREMFERGDWVTPTLGGYHWFEKPALLYWLQIVSYKIFGVSEFAARFGSAVFGLLTVFSLWILGKAEEDRRQKTEDGRRETKSNSQLATRNSQLSNWLALIAASSFGLIVFSRGASFDIILTFPITASLVGFFIFDQAAKKSFTSYHLPLIAFYFFIGLALLAKGLVGLLFPLAIVAFYYLLSRKRPSKTFLLSLLWGTLLSLLVASLWYLPMYRAHGWKFVDEFFIQHHFQRYTSNKYQHPQPVYFFFWVLPLMTLPWLPFFLASIWNFFKVQSSKFKAQSAEKLATHNSQLATFAAAWLIVPLVFFSLSGSKLPGYILPALPAALILTSAYVWQFVQKSRKRKIILLAMAALTFVSVAVIAQFFVSDFLHEETVKHLVEKADAEGFRTERIITLHTISHSAEFYGAGRLVRDGEGRQRRFFGVSEVTGEMNRQNEKQALVLIPLEYLSYLTKSELVETRVLGDNGELAMAVVKLR